MTDTETSMGMVAAGDGPLALPVGVQSFEDIRSKNFLYVDKTEYVWRLANSGKAYFLSRPRRFGKSLLTSTLEAYFQGRKDLFAGLAIESLEASRGEEAWAEYPVIRFDLSSGAWRDTGLEHALLIPLASAEARYSVPEMSGITPEGLDPANRFRYDIQQIHRLTGRQVVVLVDEYDNPLLDAADQDEGQEKDVRRLYKSFFSAVKSEDEHIRFAFFTGVTKFSGVTVFSGLNNLRDISLLDDWAGMCGITEAELRRDLMPWVDRMAEENDMTREECLAGLAAMYDGYRFSKKGPNMYNPYSLLTALQDRDFSNYWFATGTPSFLIPRLRSTGLTVEEIVDGELSMTSDGLMDYRADNPDPIPLLYQAGYLTIDTYDRRSRKYTLRFPNREVTSGFFDLLGKNMFGPKDFEARRTLDAMARAVKGGDVDGFMTRMRALLASIPYPEAPEREHEWRNQMYIILTLLGFDVTCEAHFSHGRSDCVIQTDKHVYVVEFKVDKPAAEALAQIDEKGYATPFAADTRQMHKIGVTFSTEERTITDWTEA